MTSPAILKLKEQKTGTKSPAHSEKPPAGNGNADAAQPEPFSFLRVFKLGDLMMKQGCWFAAYLILIAFTTRLGAPWTVVVIVTIN